MTAIDQPQRAPVALSPGLLAALLTLATGALCLLLHPYAPWLTAFPAGWSLPATDWVGGGLEVVLDAIKPTMRWFSWAIAFPMDWANFLLARAPWPIVIGVVTAIGRAFDLGQEAVQQELEAARRSMARADAAQLELQRDLRRHRIGICPAANAVCAEKFACHTNCSCPISPPVVSPRSVLFALS